jgi:cell division protein FtsQ
MFFKPKRNRRKVDVAKKTGELKAAAKSHSPTALKTLGLLVVSAGLAWGGREGYRWATTTPELALREVVYTGNTRAAEAELSRLGALSPGQNLVSMDVGAVERALAAHPWVRTVHAHRQLPHRLAVEVEEHVPVAFVSLGDLYLVDEDGEPFKRVLAQDGLDLPLLTGVEREDFVKDRDVATGALQHAIAVGQAYQATASAKAMPLSEVHVDQEGVTLITAQGLEIRLGEGGFEQKLERLELVRKQLSQRSLTAEVIRLDNRSRPGWITVQLQGAAVVSEKSGR